MLGERWGFGSPYILMEFCCHKLLSSTWKALKGEQACLWSTRLSLAWLRPTMASCYLLCQEATCLYILFPGNHGCGECCHAQILLASFPSAWLQREQDARPDGHSSLFQQPDPSPLLMNGPSAWEAVGQESSELCFLSGGSARPVFRLPHKQLALPKSDLLLCLPPPPLANGPFCFPLPAEHR